ncbi:MAG: ABC transporter substrate-binding protein, partial [Chloroflexota bacterium]|nr:ABC transporter substrate-binding protein [Chloroflexota bacterium]
TPTPAPTAPPTPAPTATAAPTPGQLTPVKLQLQWVTQSQFAGYFAAVDQGFYADEGLDVTILQGAVDIVPQTVVASGTAEFGIAWLPKVLASIEQGADLVNIAQVFQRSGTLEVAWATSGITKPEDWRGKKVGTWGFGNEHELFAAMRKVGIDPTNTADVTIISQDFTMDSLLNNDLDAAEAMIYNEYAQVLEATNPATGQLYQPADLSVISMESAGTAMLQDGIFAQGAWLDDPANADVATRFLRASFKGWMWCRDNFDACVQVVLDNGPTLGQGHQTWQLNEINGLIWPSPEGIGQMNADAWARTVSVAKEGAIITADPPAGAYRTDLAEAARQGLDGDVNGTGYVKENIDVTPGGN